jgi:hypothetical protein
MVPLLLLNPHTFHPHIQKVHNIFHPHLLLVPEKTEKLASPHPQETPNIPSPPPHPPPPPPSPPHETTKPTPPNGSAQNNHAKVGTSEPNTSVIGPGETPLGNKALEKPLAISKLQEEKLAKNNISTTPTAGKQALKKPSSTISKQQEKEIAVNKTSMRPTRKRSKRNTKENRRYMTNPKQFESDTEKNPWAMVNPNYKFGKNILNDGDLKKAAPFTRKLHTFYMQRGESDDASDIMVTLRPRTNAWLNRDESSNALQLMPMQLSDLYDLFNSHALDLTLLRYFIL